MDPLDFVKVLSITFITLFPIVNPIGDAPIFLGMTRRYPQSVRKVLARKIAAYGFVLLTVSFLFGSEVLAFFGITVVVIQITGGLIVALTGWSVLTEEAGASLQGQGSDTLEDALEHAFYPLTLPITIDPGCIAVAITLGAQMRHQAGAGFAHGYPRHFIAGLVGIFLVCVLVGVCYGRSERFLNMLGKSGTNILTRLSAFILMAVGVQIMWNGLSAGLPEMLAHTGIH